MEVYGTTRAALNRLTSGLGGDLHGSGIRVNAVGPRIAVMSEGMADLIGDTLPREMFESVEQTVEAVVALCDSAEDTTGRIAVSPDLIADWNLAVHDREGPLPSAPIGERGANGQVVRIVTAAVPGAP